MIDIVAYIPHGEQNAISRRELVRLTGLPDREVRELIAEARYMLPIISSGKGYYRPVTVDEVKRWLAREKKRAISVFRSMRGAREFLKNAEV